MKESDDYYVLPKHKHNKWRPEEDAALIRLVSANKNVDWNLVAKRMINRNPRQCKERWFYYLCPEVNNGEWSKEEDKLLREKVSELGTKWQKIAKFFTGRTNTNCKNRWLAMKREESKVQNMSTPEEINLDSLGDDFFQSINFGDEPVSWDIMGGIPSIEML